MMMQSSTVLLVVGLHGHHSAQIKSRLEAIGIHLSPQLSQAVGTLEKELLVHLERWWVSPRGMAPLPDGWLRSPAGKDAHQQLLRWLQPKLEGQPCTLAIHAPLSGAMLPLWRAICDQLGISLRLVLAVADPGMVADNLVHHYAEASGMDGWRAQRLWWHFNAEVLRQGRGLPLEVIGLDRCEKRCVARISAPVTAFHRRLQQLVAQPSSREAMELWLEQQPDPPALAPLPRRRSELKRRFNTWRGKPSTNHVAKHPWGYLVQLVCGSQGPVAEHLLNSWLTHGFRDFELERFGTLPGPSPSAKPWCSTQPSITIQVRGGDLTSWPTHAWLQHCPVQGESSIKAAAYGAPEKSELLLNLADLQPGPTCSQELLELAAYKHVWDPNPNRVRVLRQFGVNASVLETHRDTNTYLLPQQNTWSSCAELLGLPEPRRLKPLGTTICLGSNGPQLDGELKAPLLGIPGFTGLKITTPEQAYCLASWLQGCLHAGLELVVFAPVVSEEVKQHWGLLVQQTSPGLAPILLLDQRDSVQPQELWDELNWYRTGCPKPQACSTPTPQHRTLFDQEQSQPCASACTTTAPGSKQH
jgi:hypothetical protein